MPELEAEPLSGIDALRALESKYRERLQENPFEKRLLEDKRDDLTNILWKPVQQGQPGIQLQDPDREFNRVYEQLHKWNNQYGTVPAEEQEERHRRNRYVLEQSIRADQPHIAAIRTMAQPAQLEQPGVNIFLDAFSKAFPIEGDPARFGIFQSRWAGAHLQESLGKFDQFRYLVNAQTPSWREKQESFEDALGDWIKPQNKRLRLGSNRSPVYDPQYQPVLRASPEQVFDQYTRWVGNGGQDPSYSKYDDLPSQKKFLSPSEEAGYRDLDADNLFRYFSRKEGFYVGRRRLEQITRIPYKRGEPLTIQAQKEWHADDYSTFPDKADFGAAELAPVSPFARWILQASKLMEDSQKAFLATTRDPQNFNKLREYNPFVQYTPTWLGGEGGFEKPQPLINDYIGEYTLPVGTGVLSLFGGPEAFGVWSAFMLGLFDDVPEGLKSAAAGILNAGQEFIYTQVPSAAIRARLGKHEFTYKDIDRIARVPGRWLKSMAGTPTLETMSAKQAYDYLAQNYDTGDPDEMARIMDETLPASLYLKSIGDRVSTYIKDKRFHYWAPGALPYLFFMGNPQFGAQVSDFLGKPIDDMSVAALYLGFGPVTKQIARVTGWQGAPARVVKTPLQQVSESGPKGHVILDATRRDFAFNTILTEFKHARDHQTAREILTRAEEEANNSGPLRPQFTAFVQSAFQKLDEAETAAGGSHTKISREFRDFLMQEVAPGIADFGATEALFAAQNRLGHITGGESGRTALKISRLLDSIGDGPLPDPITVETLPSGQQAYRLKGSAGRYLTLTALKNDVKILLDLRARQREVMGIRANGLPLLDDAIRDVTNEIPQLQADTAAAQKALNEIFASQYFMVKQGLDRLMRGDRGQLVIRKPGLPIQRDVFHTIDLFFKYDVDRLWEGIPDTLLRQIGGQDLIDAIARDPAAKADLVKAAADRFRKGVYTGTEERIPPRAGGLRLDLYESIDNELIKAEKDQNYRISLSTRQLEALNEYSPSPLDFTRFEENYQHYRTVADRNAKRYTYLTKKGTGMLDQLTALRDELRGWWKNPDRSWQPDFYWQEPQSFPYEPGAPLSVRGARYALKRKKPFDSLTPELEKFLTDHFSDATRQAIVKDTFRPLNTPDLDKSALDAWNELRGKLTENADLLSRPERLERIAKAEGWSPEKLELALLRRGAAQLSYLDNLLFMDMAQKKPTDRYLPYIGRQPFLGRSVWRAAMDTYISSRAREGADLANGQRRVFMKLIKFLQRPGEWILSTQKTKTPAEAMKVMDEMRLGNFSDPAAREVMKRALFELNASSFVAGEITEADFRRFYGNAGYYHGTWGDWKKNLQGTSYAIPSKFRKLAILPGAFSFKIPEDGYYVAWRKSIRHNEQYKSGFPTPAAASSWANANLSPGYEVAIHRAWPLPLKLASGMIYEPSASLADLAKGIGRNNAAAIFTEAFRNSPYARTARDVKTDPTIQWAKTRRTPAGPEIGSRDVFQDKDGFYWLRVNDPRIPALKGQYLHEHVAQWLHWLNPNIDYIENVLSNLQKATGLNLPAKGKIWSNPLIPTLDRILEVSIGRFPKTSSFLNTSLGFLNRSLVWSKVLLSPSTWIKQITSNFLFNMPAMGVNPLDPFNWPALTRYLFEGFNHYAVKGRLPFKDWAWDALFKSGMVEFTETSFNRKYQAIHERNWASQRAWYRVFTKEYEKFNGYEARLERAKADLGAATDPRDKGIIAANIAELTAEIDRIRQNNGPGNFFHNLGTAFLDVWKGTIGDMLVKGEGPVTDAAFTAFGLPDLMAKYLSLRFLVEKQKMPIEEALSRIDAFGQNLHRQPDIIKGLAQRIGGTKFTTYPFNQLVNMANIARHHPLWAIQQLATLGAYNHYTQVARGENLDENEEYYARKYYHRPANWMTKAMHTFGRIELPGGGYHELDSLWGVFNGMSPFARSTNEIIGNAKLPTPATIAAQTAVGVFSHFGLGSVIESAMIAVTSHKDPYGEPLNTPTDVLRALTKLFWQPEAAPPWGRDFEFFWNGPAIDPLTNRPREKSDYIMRRLFQAHPGFESASDFKLKAAIDSVLHSSGSANRFYGELAYRDLLEVKVRARGGPMKPDGTVDRAALRKMVEDHYKDDKVVRPLTGLGDQEIPTPKDAESLRDIARNITQPRLMRIWHHLRVDQQMEAYALWRTFDANPDKDIQRTYVNALTRKIMARPLSPTSPINKYMDNVIKDAAANKDKLPPGVLQQLRAWRAMSLPEER